MKKGFTIIELLIVIAVIGIVAGLGVSAYSVARRAIAIELQADSLVAELQSLREDSKRSSVCVGIRLAEKEVPQKITAPFKNKIEGCGEANSQEFLLWPADTAISFLQLEGRPTKKYDILFVPPLGSIRLSSDAAQAHVWLSLKRAPELNERIVEITALSGVIHKIKKTP